MQRIAAAARGIGRAVERSSGQGDDTQAATHTAQIGQSPEVRQVLQASPPGQAPPSPQAGAQAAALAVRFQIETRPLGQLQVASSQAGAQ